MSSRGMYDYDIIHRILIMLYRVIDLYVVDLAKPGGLCSVVSS